MSEFYDKLETREPEERRQALLQAIRSQVAHAKANTLAYKELFSGLDVEELIDAESYSKLPLTRFCGGRLLAPGACALRDWNSHGRPGTQQF